MPFTVAEIRGGRAVPFPGAEVNREDGSDLAGHFQSVQSAVDPADRLWILDTGSPLFGASSYGGPKLVAVGLRTDRIVRKILFPSDVVPSDSYPNDVRFDLRRGAEGMAFITDSGGDNGIVDLATGRSWRRLAGHPSALPDPRLPARHRRRTLHEPSGGRRADALRGRLRRHRDQRRRRTPLLLPAVEPPTAERVRRRARRPGHDRGGGGPGVQTHGGRTGERRQGISVRRRPGARRPVAPPSGRHLRHPRPRARARLDRHPPRRRRWPPLRHRQPAQPPGPVPRGRGPAPQAVSPHPCADRRGPGGAAIARRSADGRRASLVTEPSGPLIGGFGAWEPAN
ncbi:L-dopachrome tautomerase-related protein [Streptomyces fuscichromogenes]|uniref:L-dopachrome tautomerase-related protein n=1 Tax=Streptomyces fuscichromogenes TaxID=1324013 RepID=UPI003822AC9C